MAYEIRAMSFAEVLDTGFRLVRDHFALLVGIGLVLYAPLAVMQELLVGATSTGEVDPATALLALGAGLLAVALSPIAQGAMTLAIGDVYRGHEMSLGEAYRGGFSRALPLVGTYLLLTLGVAVGLVLLVIPGLYLIVAWMLTMQIVMIEGLAGPSALARSRDLLKGHMWRAVGIFLIAGVIVVVLSSALQLVVSAIPIVSSVANAIAQSIGLAFYTAVGVVLYFELRCRKEDFDLEHLAQQVAAGNPTAPPLR